MSILDQPSNPVQRIELGVVGGILLEPSRLAFAEARLEGPDFDCFEARALFWSMRVVARTDPGLPIEVLVDRMVERGVSPGGAVWTTVQAMDAATILDRENRSFETAVLAVRTQARARRALDAALVQPPGASP